jgi:hypothetical protein
MDYNNENSMEMVTGKPGKIESNDKRYNSKRNSAPTITKGKE